MIFADKLIALRKKAGYSQEELAQQLNVTRQSVSKWEGAQSVPDIEKILQISKLFGVTTDYLLKDEMGEPEYAESEPTALRRVTLEQANAALAQAKVNAPYMAWGTALCVASPVMLLLLGEICQHSQFGLNENVATGIGLCVLLVMVCVAVVLFMLCGTKNRDFDFGGHDVRGSDKCSMRWRGYSTPGSRPSTSSIPACLNSRSWRRRPA